MAEQYIAIDRDRLLFGNRENTSLLKIISNCQCIEQNVKAVVEDDPSGAGLIVLSREKLATLAQETQNQIFALLNKTDAVRNDVIMFSTDITVEERIRRQIFKSRVEVENQAA